MAKQRSREKGKQKRAYQKRINISIFIFLFLLAAAAFWYDLSLTLTGYVVFENPSPQGYTAIWDFSDESDYIYNSSAIEISSSSASIRQLEHDFSEILIAEYFFDEQSWQNDTTVYDTLSNNDGVANGDADTSEDGMINRAAIFDGNADFIRVERTGHPELDPANAVTVTAWVKNLNRNNNYMKYIICRAGGSNGCSYSLFLNDGLSNDNLGVSVRTELGVQSKELAWDEMDTEWFHMAMTFSGADGTMNLYLDGNNISSWDSLGETISYRNQYSDDDLFFGSTWNSGYLNGSVDEMAIYNSALSPSEILSIYNAQSQESRTYLYYSQLAEIETADLEIDNLESFGLFEHTEELDGNYVLYYYSTDSGENWNLIDNSNLSSVSNSSGKIRIKAILSSTNGTSTPVISEMKLRFTTTCIENWSVQYGECLVDDTKLRYYTDSNSCGTSIEIPVDNSTYVECDYCSPNWNEINTSCVLTDTKTGWFNDTNNCYAQTLLASDNDIPLNNTYSCDYCIPLWDCASYGDCRENSTKACELLIDVNDCYNKTFIESDNDSSSYENKTINCTYAAPEQSESSGDSGSTTSGGSSGGGSGGSGGSSRITVNAAEGSSEEKTIQRLGKEEKEEAEVPYSFYLSILDEISFIEDSEYNFSIKNTGSYDIDEINISLSKELESIAQVQTPLITGLKKGESTSISVISKRDGIDNMIHGFAVMLVEPGSSYTFGEVKAAALNSGKVIFEQSSPILIETESLTNPKRANEKGIGLIVMSLFILFILYVFIVKHYKPAKRNPKRIA